jgi:formamidopyrimidine-DNA glycosylase
VPDERAIALHAAIREVLSDALGSGGTTFSNYRDAYGQEGDYYERRRVYARTDEPCPTCGTQIVRIVVGGRGTHYCPTCQPEPGAMLAGIVPFVPPAPRRMVAETEAEYVATGGDDTDGR